MTGATRWCNVGIAVAIAAASATSLLKTNWRALGLGWQSASVPYEFSKRQSFEGRTFSKSPFVARTPAFGTIFPGSDLSVFVYS